MAAGMSCDLLGFGIDLFATHQIRLNELIKTPSANMKEKQGLGGQDTSPTRR